MKISEIWDHLEKNYDNKPIMRLVDSSLLTRVYAGIEGVPVIRFLYIEIPDSKIELFKEVMGVQGINISSLTTNQEHSGFSTIKIASSGTDFNDEFTLVVQSLVEVMKQCDNIDIYINQVRFYLRRWRSFFKERKMTDSKEIGLFGELYFMYAMLKNNKREIEKCWVGPLMAEHDFFTNGISVEVKTTKANSIDIITISSLQQLDCPVDQQLVLSVFRIRNDDMSGVTINDLVDSVRQMIPTEDRDQFDLKLSLAGHSENYKYKKYSVLDNQYFKITSDFPKITREQVPNAIKEAKYSISLASCNDFKTNVEDLLELMG